MGYTIPIRVYEKLEEKLGRETASVIVEGLEKSIGDAFEDSKERLKIATSEDLKKELATKYDIELVRKDIEKEIEVVRKEIEVVRKEIDLVKKDMKITTIIIIAVIVILNQNSLEFIARLLGLMK